MNTDSKRSRLLEDHCRSSVKPYSEKPHPAKSTSQHSFMLPMSHGQEDLASSALFGPSHTSNGADALSTETWFSNQQSLAQTPECRDLYLASSSWPLEDRFQFGPCTCIMDSNPSASLSKRKRPVTNKLMHTS